MKVKELFEAKHKIRYISGKKELTFPDQYEVGYGMQATVFRHPRHPGTVIKKVRVREPRTDGHVLFTKLALKHQDNPFFPKIYNASMRFLNTGGQELVIQMERLHNIRDEDLAEAMKHMFERLGFDRDMLDTISSMYHYLSDPTKWNHLKTHTNNPKFREALEILEPAIKKFDGHDLHLDNFMVRLTSIGPQLVIIDPFWK